MQHILITKYLFCSPTLILLCIHFGNFTCIYIFMSYIHIYLITVLLTSYCNYHQIIFHIDLFNHLLIINYLTFHLFNHLFTYYFSFRLLTTYMCPVTEKIVPQYLTCYTSEPLFIYIYLLFKPRSNPYAPYGHIKQASRRQPPKALKRICSQCKTFTVINTISHQIQPCGGSLLKILRNYISSISNYMYFSLHNQDIREFTTKYSYEITNNTKHPCIFF